ncbi:MAG: UDP-N-acetylmuramoyl-L-alanyl-D-glutamate--2,6-diaminopimelate ligase [Candidatus Paracaedibacteraceae bacterium]|nr:UDP-N-acetylmuramoyl-L-alanyl-D-glutamate--2,6-diaminopimelate ligase [Candidatus Paracaedibacteraceae bacterium]
MYLNDLLLQTGLIEKPLPYTYGQLKVQAIKADSRTVEPFDVFVSTPCPMAIDYIVDVLSKGCRVIVTESELADHPLFQKHDALVITHSNPRIALAKLSAVFYGDSPKHSVAVTGTNGKSSTVQYVRQFWEGINIPCASVGTLGLSLSNNIDANIINEFIPIMNGASLTTLDSVRLHQLMHGLKTHNIDHLAFEASSHGLDQYRIHGVSLKAAAFTNLTQDHLDYHQTMDDYFHAKARLFTDILADGMTAVINKDSPYFKQLSDICAKKNQRIISFSRLTNATLFVKNCRIEGQAQIFDLHTNNEIFPNIRINISGDFQIENVLAALGLVLASGATIQECLPTFTNLTCATGRLERVATHNGAHFYVDYAHTPDALEKALTNLRPFSSGKLWVLFGCGGNRDTGKRQLMGKISASLADTCIVTDDNPRFEDPAAIRSEILKTCTHAIEIGNRRDAITYALQHAQAGDVVLIAGKGHEQGQIIGNITFPFDDREEILSIAK